MEIIANGAARNRRFLAVVPICFAKMHLSYAAKTEQHQNALAR